MSAVTNLAEYRAYRQSPLMTYMRLTETVQRIMCATIQFQFAAHRDFLRHFVR
jgi:hypothetical protein